MNSSVSLETQQPQSQGNPLGVASALISLASIVLCLVVAFTGMHLQNDRSTLTERIDANDYNPGSLTPATDRIGVGLSVLGQLAVYGVGALVGGTLSLIGFILGLVSLLRHYDRIGVIGVVGSAGGPLIVIACIYAM
jgi:hypothetical protein